MALVWCSLLGVLLVQIGGGVTQSTGTVAKFWNDDYKVFEQIYGKTSDKDLYEATIPPTFSYGAEGLKISDGASNKKERFISPTSATDPFVNAYGYNDKYIQFLAKQSLKSQEEQAKPSYKFIAATDFKPINKHNDPEMYKYLQHLEEFQKQKKHTIEVPVHGIGGFKPYISYAGENPEESEAYKSIQDILDAHEANKGRKQKFIAEQAVQDEHVKYFTGSKSTGRKKSPNLRLNGNHIGKSARCYSGRCRKRGVNNGGYRRPITTVRKVKHRIITDD